MTTQTLLAAAAVSLAVLVPAALPPAASAQADGPRYDQLGKARAAGEDPCYHVNSFGFGNYVRGPGGSFGCYKAGSAGAIELENEQRIKCRDYPSSC